MGGIICFRLTGVCKHVAALLYHVENCVSQGLNKACTSVQQKWHKPRKHLNTSAFLSDVKTPKTSNRRPRTERSKRDILDPRPPHLRKKKSLMDFNMTALSNITNGKAAALLYAKFPVREDLSSHHDPMIISHEEIVNTSVNDKVPAVLDIIQENLNLSYDDFIEKLTIKKDAQEYLAKETIDQVNSEVWFQQRKGRITASVMHGVLYHVQKDTIVGKFDSLVSRILGQTKSFYSKAVIHGREHEPIARKAVTSKLRKSHRKLTVQETGTWVSLTHPIIAASPDGLVNCECCGRGVLEIKCPYRDTLMTVAEYAQSGTSRYKNAQHKTVVIVENGEVVINKKHQYYTQLQTQLFCCNLDYGYLVIFTTASCDNVRYFRVEKDLSFFSSMVTKTKRFYKDVIFDKLKSEFVVHD